MKPAVRTASLQIVTNKLGAGAEAAEAYLTALATSGRYAKDVWAPGGL